MADYARTRADIDIRQTPNGVVAGRIDTADSEVEILETLGGWYRVKPVHLQKAIKGYVPPQALVFPIPAKTPVFPIIDTGDGHIIPSVPPDLHLSEFQQWQTSGGRPVWLSADLWDALPIDEQTNLSTGILASIEQDQPHWEAWLATVSAANRLDAVLMDEWVVTVEGGQDVYTIRDYPIYQQPSKSAIVCGWVMKGQIMHWTGGVRSQVEDGEKRVYYEVNFYRMSRATNGWFRADLAAPYYYPAVENDPEDSANAGTVFNLTQPILRHPQDHEFTDAKAAGYTGAQYLNLRDVVNRSLRHFMLCGEICVSALAGRDVIPVLQDWCASRYWRVQSILNNPQEGTGSDDLVSLLRVVGMSGETYSSMPTTIPNIKARLDRGEFAIATCRITPSGKVKENARILHWVILEDVLPVGNSGWVRIYNPFNNQEEIYSYNLFIKAGGGGFGLWVTGAKRNGNEN